MTRMSIPRLDTPENLKRAEAEITRILTSFDARLRALEIATGIETDILRAPRRIGSVAVVGADVYIAAGITPADWVQVN